MPAGILPNEGLGLTLSELLGRAAIPLLPWKLVLWVNDITPTYATTWGQLVEASWIGYGRENLDRATWNEPTVSAGCAHATYGTDPFSFNVTGGPLQTVYGCAYLDTLNGVLRFVQRFDPADVKTVEIGSVYKVPPLFTLTSAEC